MPILSVAIPGANPTSYQHSAVPSLQLDHPHAQPIVATTVQVMVPCMRHQSVSLQSIVGYLGVLGLAQKARVSYKGRLGLRL